MSDLRVLGDEMSSRFCLLGVESRDFGHAEKERTAKKAEQIHE